MEVCKGCPGVVVSGISEETNNCPSFRYERDYADGETVVVESFMCINAEVVPAGHLETGYVKETPAEEFADNQRDME